MKHQPHQDTAEEIRRMDECGALANDFREMTKYLTREARWYALDGFACVLHNQGYALESNTEANDALWMARSLAAVLDHGRDFDRAPSERQEELKLVAAAAIRCLPGLCERIASRYINLSKAMRCMETVARHQAQQMREKIP